MSSLSLKSFVKNSKLLSGLLTPVGKAYAGAAGYRQIGKKKKQAWSISKKMLTFLLN